MRAASTITVQGNVVNDGVSLDQQLGAAGNLLINGALASSGIAKMLYNSTKASLISTGNLSAVNFTITGEDDNQRPVVETIAGPNNNTVYTTKYFKTISKISADAAVPVNVKVGSSQYSVSNIAVADPDNTRVVGINTISEATGGGPLGVTHTVQYTLSDIQTSVDSAIWHDVTTHSNIVNGNYASAFKTPSRGYRIKLDSFSNGKVTANFV